MKIKEKDGDVVDIFATYCIDGECYFWGIPKNYGGLLSYRSSEVEVIDPILTGKWIYRHNSGYGVFYWALIEKNLLNDLTELNETAYKHFLEIIKSEGLVDPDFY